VKITGASPHQDGTAGRSRRIAKAIVRPHIDMNSAAVQTQRTTNGVALAETARNASAMFAISAMLAHRPGQLKMPRLDAYVGNEIRSLERSGHIEAKGRLQEEANVRPRQVHQG